MQIQRLNMDNSWFIDFRGTRMLVDPWLTGKEVYLFPWFNAQWHRTRPLDPEAVPPFDMVLITQKYADHFHKETLKLLGPKRIALPQSVAGTCRKWLPEADLVSFNQGVQRLFGTNINLHFFPTRRKIDPIYDALVLEDGSDAIFIASHGFSLTDEQQELVRQLPPVKLLITPFNLYKLPAFLGGIVSPGLKGVQQLVKAIDPLKVVATHDENKFAQGLVSQFARITRAPGPEELNRAAILEGRYLHIDHYDLVTL